MVKNNSNNPPDYILAAIIGILVAGGLLILASVSIAFSLKYFGNPYYLLNHQILFGFLPGLILGFIAFKMDLTFIKKISPILFLLNLFLLLLVFIPKIGTGLRGASRWVDAGPISFQPSEIIKLTFILYLSAWLAARTEKNTPKKSKFIKFRASALTFAAFLLLISLMSAFLILQPDITTLGIIIFTAGVIYFTAGTPFWQSLLLILMGAGALFSLIKLAPYRAARLLVFLKPETDPMGVGYQIKQALIAVGSGGIFGLGFGMSRQKFGYLPQAMSDSIFAIFTEETGFVGAVILLCVFFLFLWRGLKISKAITDKFSQLAAIGIVSWIASQAFINIGAMISILPLGGIPLPFVSYGGSHLITELIAAGILLNISKNRS